MVVEKSIVIIVIEQNYVELSVKSGVKLGSVF